MMRTVIVLALLLCLAPNLWADGFGYGSAGSFSIAIDDTVWAHISAPASSGTLDSLKARLSVTTAAHNVKAAVYKWSDTSFVDSTEIVNITNLGTDWIYFDFIGNASITADTQYALAVWAEGANGSCKVFFEISGGTHAGQLPYTYAVWPTPKWTTVNQSGSYKFSIYCFYTAPEAVAGQIFILQQ